MFILINLVFLINYFYIYTNHRCGLKSRRQNHDDGAVHKPRRHDRAVDDVGDAHAEKRQREQHADDLQHTDRCVREMQRPLSFQQRRQTQWERHNEPRERQPSDECVFEALGEVRVLSVPCYIVVLIVF